MLDGNAIKGNYFHGVLARLAANLRMYDERNHMKARILPMTRTNDLKYFGVLATEQRTN